jgi:ankyrin repeat protein
MNDDEIMTLHARVLELELALDRSLNHERSLRSTIDQLQLALMDSSPSERSLHHPASTEASSDIRERPVLDAAARGDTVALQLLLQSRAAPGGSRHTRDDALIVAAEGGHLDTVRFLVEIAGADVRAGHDSAMLWACRNGSLELLEYLVSRGADVAALGRCGIALAVSGGHDAIVQAILSHSSFFGGNT